MPWQLFQTLSHHISDFIVAFFRSPWSVSLYSSSFSILAFRLRFLICSRNPTRTSSKLGIPTPMPTPNSMASDFPSPPEFGDTLVVLSAADEPDLPVGAEVEDASADVLDFLTGNALEDGSKVRRTSAVKATVSVEGPSVTVDSSAAVVLGSTFAVSQYPLYNSITVLTSLVRPPPKSEDLSSTHSKINEVADEA